MRRATAAASPFILTLLLSGAPDVADAKGDPPAGVSPAAVASRTIGSNGPLTAITIGNELSCQVAHAGDSQFEFYPATTAPADCGTFVVDGGTLYAPNFLAHAGTATGLIGPRTPFTPVAQSPVTGAGTAASPFITTATANAGVLQLVETDSYVAGRDAYRTDVSIRNTSATPRSIILYRAGDCHLAQSDSGRGFAAGGRVACTANANDSPPGRVEEWIPITPGSRYLETTFGNLWSAIGSHTPFPNTCDCTTNEDNAAGLSWSLIIGPKATTTVSQLTAYERDVSAVGPCTRTITGSVASSNFTASSGDNLCFQNATIGGSVTILTPNVGLSFINTVISGSVVSDAATAFTMCNTKVGGSLTITHASGLILVGDGGDGDGSVPACQNNVFGQAVTLANNTGGIELGGNTVAGVTSVVSNTSPATLGTEVEGNTTAGLLHCVANTPAPTNGGFPNTRLGGSDGQCAAPF